jgi:N-acetylmuramoyl-L-alanine amidase
MGFPGPWIERVQTVCIDPGHGGSDRGRVREADALFPLLEEAEYTLIQGLQLRDRLEARGYVVVMTRTTDTDVNANEADVNGDGKTKADSERDGIFDEMQARINICNRAQADLMISIHINGYDTERPSGYETWYTLDREFGAQSRRIAELTHEALGSQLAAAGYTPEARGVKDDGSVSVDDSDPTLESHMLITGPELPGRLTPSQMPGVIVEGLFITNPDDAAFLVSDGGISAIVTGYENAVIAYFNEYEF